MMGPLQLTGRIRIAMAAAAASLLLGAASPVSAQVTAFKQALAESASSTEALSDFYRGTGFEPIWTGAEGQVRLQALFAAFEAASDHGLPADRFDTARLVAALDAARTPAEQGRIEAELTRLFLDYARMIESGVVVPRQVDSDIKRDISHTDPQTVLEAFLAAPRPTTFIRDLAPSSPEYARLLRQKARLQRLIAAGGWGPAVPNTRLEPGMTGPAVVALRDRLIAMGYLERSASGSYDSALERAVEAFQAAHGLTVDGVMGEGTVREINRSPEERLRAIAVAMERERWLNRDRGDRYVWVNLTDFSATIVDHEQVTFRTRSVIGADYDDRETPEFSDVMEFMVINPSWYVPRSIATGEYLPMLQRNPNAVRHLVITDSRGRAVNRGAVNFSAYNSRSFPFAMRQPPGPTNALGRVKFMFPNQYNIYLHDTPARSLFSREVRTFSHGCVRLNDPLEFGYALLAMQEDDPVSFFNSRLRSGAETRVNLEDPVPVHIVYRTAFTDVRGEMNYRRDVYGRDARVWQALRAAGVVLTAPGS